MYFQMKYPSKQAYVFSEPLNYPFPWLNPEFQERIIQKGDFMRDIDSDLKVDEDEEKE